MNATMTATAANDDFAAPTRVDGFKELRTGWDMIRLAARTPELLRAPQGNGRAVVLVPGLRASDASLLPLRNFLAQRGHDARPWGLGTNTGDLDTYLPINRVTEAVADMGLGPLGFMLIVTLMIAYIPVISTTFLPEIYK